MGATVGPIDFEFAMNSGMIDKEFKRVNAGLKGISQQAAEEAKQMRESYRNAAAAIGAYFTLDFAKGFIGDMATMSGEFQKYSAVLENTLGSSERAQAAMKMLAMFAATTPFQLSEVTGAFVKLANQGFTPTYRQMVMLGDLASSTGKDFNMLAEAIIDAQTGEFERLKEFGIKASKQGDQVSFSFKGVQTQVDFTNDSIRDYIVSLGTLNGVAGANAKISATLGGEISNLKDKWDMMLNAMGQSNGDVLSGGIGLAGKAIDHYKDVIDILKVLVATYGTYKAVLIATTAIQSSTGMIGNIRAWMSLAATIRTAKDAQVAFNLATTANPFGAIAAAIALVVTSLYIYSNRQKEAAKEQSLHAKTQEEYTQKLIAEQAQMDSLIALAKNEKASRDDRRKALDKLKESAGGYLDKLTLENIGHKDGADLLKKYNDQLERKYRIEANEAEIKGLYATLRSQNKGIALSQGMYDATKKRLEKDMGDMGGQTIMVMGNKLADLKVKAQQTKAQIDALLLDNVAASTPTVTPSTPIKKDKDSNWQQKTDDALYAGYWKLQEEWQKEREKAMDDLVDSITKSDEKSLDGLAKKEEEFADKFADIYNSSMTFEQKRDSINRKYNDEAAIMRKAGMEANAKNLEKQRDKELVDLQQSNIEELGNWKYLFDNIDRLSVASLKLRIDRLKVYNEQYAKTDAEKLAVAKATADAENELINKGSLAALKSINERIAKAKVLLANATTLKDKDTAQAKLDDATADKSKLLSATFSNVAGHLSNIAGIVGEFNEGLGEAIQLASGLASVFSQVASGNYVGAAISMVGSVLTLAANQQKKDQAAYEKQKKEEIDAINRQIEATNRLYEAQSKLLDKALGLDKLSQMNVLWLQARDNIKKTIDQIAKIQYPHPGSNAVVKNREAVKLNLLSYGATLRDSFGGGGRRDNTYTNEQLDKALTIDELLKINEARLNEFYKKIEEGGKAGDSEKYAEVLKLIDEYQKYAEQLEEIANKQKEILTGSTYDSVVSGLAKAFEDGIISAEEFASSFGDLMQKEVMNTLKLEYLEKPMKEWYAKFAEASKDGLTKEEIEALRTDYMKYAGDAKVGFDQMNEIMKSAGVDLFGSATAKESSMTGQIKAALTEDTGSILSGNVLGLRYDVRDIVSLNRQQLSTLQGVERNTLVTADRLGKLEDIAKRLENIENKLGGSSTNDLRAIGRF